MIRITYGTSHPLQCLLLLLCVLPKFLHTLKQNKITVSGLFPIHSNVLGSQLCGELNIERGIHRLEAMLFAVDQINRNKNFLTDIEMDVDIYDTCDQDTIALEGAVKSVIKKVSGSSNNCNFSKATDHFGVAGIIGAASSSVSIQVANLLRLFKMPQISYSSTSSVLNDRKRYSFFSRTVPSDTLQVNAMVDVLKYFEWTSVFILYSSGNYGESASEALSKASQVNDICIVEKFQVDYNTDFSKIIDNFKKHNTTKVVIVFCDIKSIRMLLNAVANQNENFVWLASEYWGTGHTFLNNERLKDAANGAITLTLKSETLSQEFKDYFYQLRPGNNARDPWFDEYWVKKYNCLLASANCINLTSVKNIQFDDKINFVIDAVYALANAIDVLYKENCLNKTAESCSIITRGSEVMKTLMNIPYPSTYGWTRFNDNGSANPGYNIMYYTNKKYINIGTWTGNLSLTGEINETESYCSEDCDPGFVKRRKRNTPSCCYTCFQCEPNQYTDKDNCKSCEKGYYPNVSYTGCEKLPLRHISSTWVIIISSLAGLGIIFTVATILIFLYYKDTDVVRASAPELSFPLLVGVLLCYMLPFVIMADQTVFFCGIRRFGLGFCFSICYSALLTKTNRLARVFNENRISKRAPRFITASSQLLILMGLVFMSCGFGLIGLYLETPTLIASETNDGIPKDVLHICDVPMYDMITSYAYNFILVLICTVYAFRTRKVPAWFNEARYIGFVMFTTCVVWLSFIPVYSMTISDDNTIIALCMNITLNSTSILAGLFGPKLYIIIFRSARNNRSSSTRSFTHQSSSLAHSYSHHSVSQSDLDRIPRKITMCSDIAKVCFE